MNLHARIRELERTLADSPPGNRDVTLNSDLFRELVEDERRYRQLVEHSGAFICIHDLEGVLLSVNRSAAEQLGYRPDEMVGRNLRDFLDPDAARWLKPYLAETTTKVSVSGVMHVRCRNGEIRTWAYHNSRYEEPGKPACVLGRAQDITEMKRLEETLKLTQLSIDRAVDAVFWITSEGRLRYVNDAACHYLGFSREELLSISIYDIDFTLDRAEWPAHWEQVKQLERFTTETIYRAKDGRNFPVEVTINFLSFRGQEYHCVFARENSERKEAEDALIATTARLEGLIENLQVGILFEGDNRKVVLANQTLCQMLDIPVPPNALTGADSRTLLDQCKHLFPVPDHFLMRVEQILKAHSLLRNEEISLADGRVLARDYIPIVNKNYRAHLWQYRDVTERKQAEAEILRAKFEAEKANAAKSSFLAMMSHELRTPLNAIFGMTELSLETKLSSEQREFLRTIQTNSENLLRLIDDVLDLSKIEANRMDIEQIPFEPRELVEEVAESLNLRAATKNVELVLDIDPNLPSEISGDSQRIRQILVNLVGNAIKFTEKGSVQIAVDVEDWKPGGRVDLAFAVTDTGIGIPADKQENLFSRFYQAESSTTRRFGGTGLGLSISRSLAELMGGRIDFTSTAGKGSTFRLALTTDVPEGTESNAVLHRAQLGEQDVTICLAMDHTKHRRALSRLLKAWGFDVEVEEPKGLAPRLPNSAPERTITLLEHRPEQMDLLTLRKLRQPPNRELVLLTSMGVNTSTVLTETCPYLVVKPIRQIKLAEVLGRALGLRAQAAPAESKPPAERIVQHRVLLVEDNPDNQKLAARVLEGAGARVDTAENGEEAVAMAKATLYDLVIMDLMMPVMDGFQATRAIRTNEAVPNRVPIVALTAHATEGFRDRCLEAGMDDYLSKPFKKDRFLAVVEQWADRRPIILVADDAPENRLIVKRFLMLGGDYRLVFATNGQEALDRFDGHDVSLVLLDMEMPVLDGFETARALKNRARVEDGVPIIAMTAHHDTEELKRCLDAGCTTVVQKPLERKLFNGVVSKYLVPRVPGAESALPENDNAQEEQPSRDDVVAIDPDIQDLVPKFLDNQRNNAKGIPNLVSNGDFDSIRRLGHNMKGTGKGYGFGVISAYGASLEQAASRRAAEEVERLGKELADYLSLVEWRPRT